MIGASPSSSSQSGSTALRQEELELLLRAIAAGDHAAMTNFYAATHKLVFALAVRLVGDRAAAEEVTLDVFMQVWRKASSYANERGKVVAWLLTISRSRALDRVRSRKASERERGLELDESASSNCVCDPHEEPARSEHCHLVRKALAALPNEQRRAVEFAFLDGLSHAEIALRTGDPLGTVKTRVRLGMIKLREILRPLEQLT